MSENEFQEEEMVMDEVEEPVYIDQDDQMQPPPFDMAGTNFSHLSRKPTGIMDNSQDFYFMLIDLDCELTHQHKPFIRIFGSTQSGQSASILVKEYTPYFYVPLLPKINPSQNNRLFLIEQLNKVGKNSQVRCGDGILDIEFVHKKNIRAYSKEDQKEEKKNFMKIYFKNPTILSRFRTIFQKGFSIENDRFPESTYESNVPYVLQFMVEKDIIGMGWVKISAGSYRLVPDDKKRSTCQLQIECHHGDVSAVSGQNRWDKLAPLRILSFDIECGSQRGFPDDKVNPIITIGVVCKTTGEDIVKSIVITLDDCLPIPGVEVISHQEQSAVLQAFQEILRAYDPDFIIGYNMVNFDFKYIMGRAQALRMDSYGYFGRMRNSRSNIVKQKYLSKAMGMRQTSEITIIGRIKLDMMIHMHREHQLSSYSLNSVSAIFLNEEKEDVHHSQIWHLFKRSSESRKRLAEYCVKDAYLPLKLMEKLMCLYNYTEMARVTGVSVNFLFKRGQQIKVISQLLRKIKSIGLVIPSERARGVTGGGVGFQGAYVLEPKKGFYTYPVATLDFASLYPSIMIAYNLCYTTLLRPSDIQSLKYKQGVHYQVTPGGNCFAKKEEKLGILPSILNDLLSARKRAKQQLAKATNQELRAVFDGRQLALKVSANSVYGFTGALIGQLPCLQISASVTGIGRNLIDFTSKKVVELYPGADVLYGDTDSVMVKFKLGEPMEGRTKQSILEEAMRFGRQAAKTISKEISRPPISLEFQKIYYPFLLMSKKRYSGLLYTRIQKPDKLDKKGFQSVRRDNCSLIRQMLEFLLKKIFQGNKMHECIAYIKNKISDLLMNRIDLSELIITKSINRKLGQEEKPSKHHNNKTPANKYKVKQAHVELAEKMMQRDHEKVIEIGDRIPYIIIKGAKGSKNYENAEDPQRVLDCDLPIDCDYYIQKQIRPPLQRLLVDTNIMPNLDALFNGQHTKSRYIPRLISENGLGKFMKPVPTCCGCKTESKNLLCPSCQSNYTQVYLRKKLQLQTLSQAYNKLWTHCQQCQGSVINSNICSNTDCKIYFKRYKVKKEVQRKHEEFKKIQSADW